ncbi:LysE family transporter [Roseomonas sp. E05]|uniref:LysE family transporter n=1 Tax=Roseomonas sp. E05 TaxID=3046310 RepID=UPI0024BADED2|nr:LysE family transporter [Roseomonas sp. E05]MDJ0389104.1 LysE family transporter [Roseomonas sp. E05]
MTGTAVASLLYPGLRPWCAAPADLTAMPPAPGPARRIRARAFLVSLANPKTLLFYGAFSPQFVAPELRAAAAARGASASFLALAVLAGSGWRLAATRARRRLPIAPRG